MFPRTTKAYTLVEIMLVVALISFLLAIALPAFFRARELSRMRSCQETMHKIDGAKEQWALDNHSGPLDEPTWPDLVGTGKYLRKTPTCPTSGTYSINVLSMKPECSLSTQTNYPHEFDASPPGAGGGGT